ncbi:hypothetical protein DP113_16945 [Brasilonema octagenarum UFV-E1]|uniref:Uncharacterized protein n=1 Tax=Brasilonema sennae CENA114 TaxID=415709 RepID=A0A856MJP7_9CYAN|nr:hypothetical protein DP114_17010 [Brasilonema sennae CENA114]QDL15733.1 hypothetical protein DP113_16945 [Brasilonema octagenarum UFV-E1]
MISSGYRILPPAFYGKVSRYPTFSDFLPILSDFFALTLLSRSESMALQAKIQIDFDSENRLFNSEQ